MCIRDRLFTGPPSHKEDDAKVVHELMTNADIRIVSGGTTSQIVARELGVEVKSSTEIYDKEVPPIAYIHGINSVSYTHLDVYKRQVLYNFEYSNFRRTL